MVKSIITENMLYIINTAKQWVRYLILFFSILPLGLYLNAQDSEFPEIFSGDADMPFHYCSLGSRLGYAPGEYWHSSSTTYDFSVFRSFGELEDNLFAVMSNGKWGYCDRKGKLVIPAVYDRALPFVNSIAAVCKNNKWGYIDRKGKLIIPLKFDGVGSFEDTPKYFIGVAFVSDNNFHSVYMIDGRGNRIDDKEYSRCGSWRHGICPVKINGKWGYIDKNGQIKIAPQFDEAYSFKGLASFATVKIGDLYGVITPRGDYILPAKYPSKIDGMGRALCFEENGKTAVYIPHKEAVVGRYDEVKEINADFLAVKNNDLWGIMGPDGNMVVDIVLHDILSGGSNIVAVLLPEREFRYLHIPTMTLTDEAYFFPSAVSLSSNTAKIKKNGIKQYLWLYVVDGVMYTKIFDKYAEACDFNEKYLQELRESYFDDWFDF